MEGTDEGQDAIESCTPADMGSMIEQLRGKGFSSFVWVHLVNREALLENVLHCVRKRLEYKVFAITIFGEPEEHLIAWKAPSMRGPIEEVLAKEGP